MKWFWEKLFDEFEARDWILIIISFMVFILFMADKIPDNNIKIVITGMGGVLGGYLAGRPNLKG